MSHIIKNIFSTNLSTLHFIISGWWQYDERTSKELEECYKAGERTCELLIAGFLYVTDLEAMLQIRRNDPSRRRRIKRDLASISKKGLIFFFCFCTFSKISGEIYLFVSYKINFHFLK